MYHDVLLKETRSFGRLTGNMMIFTLLRHEEVSLGVQHSTFKQTMAGNLRAVTVFVGAAGESSVVCFVLLGK